MIQQVIAEVPEPITEQIEVPGYSLGRIIGEYSLYLNIH